MTLNLFKNSYKLICSSLFSALAMTISSNAEVTAPVGYVELTFLANADTPFSIPMNRPKVYAGKAHAAVATNTVTIENNDLVAGAYDEGPQHKTHYLLFTSGTHGYPKLSLFTLPHVG